MKAAFSLCILACVAACDGTAFARAPAADSVPSDVTFRLAGANGAVILVPVFLNGHGPFDFVLDTGATLTCVNQQLADRLHLAHATNVKLRTGGVSLNAAGPIRLVRVDSVRTGQSTVRRLLGCTLDLEQVGRLPGTHIDGLLGLNFLKSFRVTLDFERSTLRLEPR